MTDEVQLKKEIMVCVSGATDHRLRPHDVEKTLSHKLGVSRQMVHQGIKDLVEQGTLAYTYRDPASYIETAEAIRTLG
jgi:predicted transcriptional regulator